MADARSPAAQTRPGQEMIGDRLVVATVLYRLASSELARKMADPRLPAVPRGPPAARRPPRAAAGRVPQLPGEAARRLEPGGGGRPPPHDLVDLVEAYADAYPAERAEATRIFLVTTYGATALPIADRARDGEEAFSTQLAALTADVLFGRR